MKRFLALLLCALLLTACVPTLAEETITVTDHVGNEVTVPRDIQRIVVCDIYPLPSVLSVFFDSAAKIVGMAGPSMSAAKNSLLGQLYPEILSAETGFINGTEVNVEELLKLNPDVVFYSSGSTEEGELLKKAGFNAIAISASKWDYDCIETLKQWFALLGQLFPENDLTQVVSQRSDEIYELVQGRVGALTDAERARAFFLFQYSDSSILTAGEHFFGQWWCDAIGAINVAREMPGNNAQKVNLEQVYGWNPDLIFITNFTPATPNDLFTNAIGSDDWSGIAAVENQRVFKTPLGMYRSYTPGVDTPITLLWLAKTAYPALFEDIDVTAEAVRYYQDVFGITLTAEQVQTIFAPVAAAASGF
ncbi:MAG: ABC transporter substrate-binding protein [Eubacteriales bacterium]|nr:ABC transporter substrate-binding protein [Eubacteriales bacterium]